MMTWRSLGLVLLGLVACTTEAPHDEDTSDQNDHVSDDDDDGSEDDDDDDGSEDDADDDDDGGSKDDDDDDDDADEDGSKGDDDDDDSTKESDDVTESEDTEGGSSGESSDSESSSDDEHSQSSSGESDEETSGEGDDDDDGSSDVPGNDFCKDVTMWSDDAAQLEEEILVIVNQERAKGADCGSKGSFDAAGPLTMQPALRCAARVHSLDMADRDFFDHTNPDGDGPGQRIEAAGYEGRTWGENIAAGNSTAAATMKQWMGSDGHCANIMNPDFTEIGVGYAPGGEYGHLWTQAFGG